MHMFRLWITTFALCCSVIAGMERTEAQPAELRFTVLGGDKVEIVPKPTIILMDEQNTVLAVFEGDERGTFSIAHPGEKKLQLSVAAVGYKAMTFSVSKKQEAALTILPINK